MQGMLLQFKNILLDQYFAAQNQTPKYTSKADSLNNILTHNIVVCASRLYFVRKKSTITAKPDYTVTPKADTGTPSKEDEEEEDEDVFGMSLIARKIIFHFTFWQSICLS